MTWGPCRHRAVIGDTVDVEHILKVAPTPVPHLSPLH